MGASNATSLIMDAIDFTTGTEELGLQRSIYIVDTMQNSEQMAG